MNIWRVLGLEPTRDLNRIRRAYAKAARQFHPEEQPEEFQRVHDAYEQAVAYARRGGGRGESPGGPAKSYSSADNKTKPKKVSAQAFASPSGQRSSAARRRRPTAEARIAPLPGRSRSPQPSWLEEETPEGQAELYQKSPAMEAFRAIYLDEKRRGDKRAWQDYFTSPVFLEVQREAGFTAALCRFVRREREGRSILPPPKFLLELSMAYGVRYESGDKNGSKAFYTPYAAFEGIASIRDVTGMGSPVQTLGHEEDKIFAAAFQDYFELLALQKNGGFENPAKTGRWQEIFGGYQKHRLTEKPERTAKHESEVSLRHPDGVRLLAYFVEKNPLPPEALQYLYDKLELESAATSSVKRYYQPLLEAVAPRLPDQTAVKAERAALHAFFTAAGEFLKRYDKVDYLPHTRVIHAYDTQPSQRQLDDARALLHSPEFEAVMMNPKITDSTVFWSLLDAATCMPQALAQRYAPRRGAPLTDDILARCMASIRRKSHDPEFFIDRPYAYEGTGLADVTLDHPEFWHYYLSAAFPAGLSTEREEPLGEIVKKAYDPSMGWRRAFVGYDEGARRVPSPRTLEFSLGERKIAAEFHLFYVRFLVDGEETPEAFAWEDFLAGAAGDDLAFWLALPLARGEDSAQRAVRREILGRMKALPLDEITYSRLADCLVNHVCTARKNPQTARLTRGEDGRKLFGCEVRRDRTLEVFQERGILRRCVKRWDRPFPTEEAAALEGAALLESLLAPPIAFEWRTDVRGRTPLQKAEALVDCLGMGRYTEEDRQRDLDPKLREEDKMPATDDFLVYGAEHHGGYTAKFYRAHLRHPCLGAVRFGEQPGERFRLDLTLEVFPFASPKARTREAAALRARLGGAAMGCHVVGAIGFGGDRCILVSSDKQKKLYAAKDRDSSTYSSGTLPGLLAELLCKGEWNEVAFVERYREGAPENQLAPL